MPGTADVISLENDIGKNVALQAQVVLIDIRRSQVWVNHKDGATAVNGEELREIDVRRRGSGGKWVCGSIRLIRLLEVTCRPALAHAVEEETRLGIKCDLAVELQVVFALQDVIETSTASTQAGLTTSGRIPGKAEARRKVLLVREVHAGW